jgi:hypothetical protein
MRGDRPPKQYFSQRHGRGPKAGPLGFDSVRKLVVNVLDDFREREYFQEAFGYTCVDAGLVNGTVGSDPNAFFLRKIMRENLWPYWEEVCTFSDGFNNVYEPRWTLWDADTLCDVIEVLHDMVSKPVDGRYHDYANCGWHYDKFDRLAGQADFRREMTDVLRMGDPAYEFDDLGHIVEAAPAEFRQLLEAPVPEGTEHDLITRKIDSAVSRFRTRGASIEDRHAAVRDLADVLEALRQDMKVLMLPKDESDLFQIANGFAIRHNNRKQRGDYDRVTWLRWAFYVYLATTHAVLRVRDRDS